MREAIATSGYLFEQRLVPVIERFGFRKCVVSFTDSTDALQDDTKLREVYL